MDQFPKLKEKVRMVVFCGGYGTRLWPMARESLPKQFQPLLGEKSFFREALDRVELVFKPKDIYLSTSAEQVKFIKKYASEIPQANIIAEPERRDNLGAIGFSTVFIDKLAPDSLMAVTWSDQYIRDREQYARSFLLAARVCQKEKVICKIDVKPPYPATQLGWIKFGKQVGKVGAYPVYEFEKHVEKPPLAQARKMFKQDNWLINAGFYVWRTSTMLSFLEKHSPKTYQILKKIRAVLGTSQEKKLVPQLYHQIEKISVDFGLFEKLLPGSQLVIPVDIGWHDIGTWDLLYEALAHGQKQNISQGEVEFRDSRGSLVYLPKDKIAAIIGVDNLVVVDTPGALLVCKRGLSAEVKKFFTWLKENNKKGYF